MVFARPVRLTLSVVASCALIAPMAQAAPSAEPAPEKKPEAVGHGGAVSSVDPDATQAGIEVLRKGGTAADAAVAVAAALGVTEPYSSGVGGGGFFVHYDAESGKVSTIDGRETAPASADKNLFLENGKEIPFDDAVTSGRSVGVPGTPLTWKHALERWGKKDFGDVLKPAEKLARDGFVVDETFREQTADNKERFKDFPATRDLFMPGGKLPKVGSQLRNPDLADTYKTFAEKGLKPLYEGEIGADVAEAVQNPPVDPNSDRKVRPGDMTREDLKKYKAIERKPTHVDYRGLDVYGMGPVGSGGTTVGEALNMLEKTDLSQASKKEYLHRFIEASKIGFADRNRWVGDPEFSDVPTKELLSQKFADSRECLISDDKVLPTPVKAGDPHDPKGCQQGNSQAENPYEGPNTTHLTVADKSGDVVSYTLTIEQTGGSAITVPDRGFLLNNELTDFSFTPTTPGEPDPNLPGPSKRPRSSMSPTIVLKDGKPLFAAGSPGGSTIITTALQVVTGRVDRNMSLLDAIAEPRATEQNDEETIPEAGFMKQPVTKELRALGHKFGEPEEIGAATGVELLPDGRWLAAAEPERRGGGSAAVVEPGN